MGRKGGGVQFIYTYLTQLGRISLIQLSSFLDFTGKYLRGHRVSRRMILLVSILITQGLAGLIVSSEWHDGLLCGIEEIWQMFEKCECGLSILIGVKKKKGGGHKCHPECTLCVQGERYVSMA